MEQHCEKCQTDFIPDEKGNCPHCKNREETAKSAAKIKKKK